MEGVHQYILSIVCIATICAIIHILFDGNGTLDSVIKLVTALVLSITVITPLCKYKFEELEFRIDGLFDDGTQAVQRGESVAMETMTQLIKEETESYILGKAAALGQTISVDVRVGDGQPPVPMEVSWARKSSSSSL